MPAGPDPLFSMPAFRQDCNGIALATVLCLFFLFACATPQVQPAQAPTVQPPIEARTVLDRARRWIAASDFGRARGELEPLRGAGLDQGQMAEIRFLLGLASYREVCTALGACEPTPQYRHMGFLTVEQVNSLSSAHGDLLAASDLSPDAPFAAQAVYLAARTLDYGFLQDFVRAMELYRWCFVFYPGTPEAMRSRERYEDLKSKFEGIEGTGHGE